MWMVMTAAGAGAETTMTIWRGLGPRLPRTKVMHSEILYPCP